MGLYGAERWILALVKHLDRARVESIVGAIKDDPSLDVPLCLEARKLGFRTKVFEAHGRFNWGAVREVRRFLRSEAVQVLHTHQYKQDLIGLLAAAGTGCRVVSTPHGWSTHADWKLRSYEWLDRRVFRFCDAVVPLSRELRDELSGRYGVDGRLRLIENGVDLTEIDEASEPAPETKRWKEGGAFVVGYVGQLIPRKGLDVLLRAVRMLPARSVRVAVVGSGEQEGELRALAAELGLGDAVSFLGFRDDRLAWLRGFDAFVLPSLLEGIPRCLMEAMAAGVPAVASDIPGCRDLVKSGETGLLFPLGDVRSLGTHLDTLRRDPELRHRLGAAGREKVRARHSAARMAQEYEALFRSVASRGAPS
jgi:glycosyltransferase involved in cell wall biosynthesis